MQIDLPDPPALEGSSAEPVLLRYRFAVGDSYTWTATSDVRMNIDAENTTQTGAIVVETGGTYVVQAVDSAGAGTIELTMDRLAMSRSMGANTVNYDSDDPAFARMLEGLNQGVFMTISTLGEVGTTGTGAAANSFVSLSEGPVAVGETLGSGSIRMQTGQGNVELGATYEVLSISGDGSEVLLRPHLDLSTALGPVWDRSVETSRVEGWMLFDVEMGTISKSAIGIYVEFAVEGEGASGGGVMVVNMLYEITDVVTGAAVPEPEGTGSSVPAGIPVGTGQGAATQ